MLFQAVNKQIENNLIYDDLNLTMYQDSWQIMLIIGLNDYITSRFGYPNNVEGLRKGLIDLRNYNPSNRYYDCKAIQIVIKDSVDFNTAKVAITDILSKIKMGFFGRFTCTLYKIMQSTLERASGLIARGYLVISQQALRNIITQEIIKSNKLLNEHINSLNKEVQFLQTLTDVQKQTINNKQVAIELLVQNGEMNASVDIGRALYKELRADKV